MKQTQMKLDKGTAIELEIAADDVFTEDFRHYAKLLFLATVSRSILPMKAATSFNGSELEFGDPSESNEDIMKDVAAKLCEVAANSVAKIMSETSEELKDEEKLNAALVELFGDLWDPENHCFKKSEV